MYIKINIFVYICMILMQYKLANLKHIYVYINTNVDVYI